MKTFSDFRRKLSLRDVILFQNHRAANSRPYIVGSTNCTLNTHFSGCQGGISHISYLISSPGRRGRRPLQKHPFLGVGFLWVLGALIHYSQKERTGVCVFVYKTLPQPLAFSNKKYYNNRTIGKIVSIPRYVYSARRYERKVYL